MTPILPGGIDFLGLIFSQPGRVNWVEFLLLTYCEMRVKSNEKDTERESFGQMKKTPGVRSFL
jgi:hypothetical protein